MTSRPRSSLLNALAWFVPTYGLAIVGYMASSAIAGRWLGTDRYGTFIIAMTLTAFLGQISLVGAHRSGLREAARLEESESDPLWVLRLIKGDARVATHVTIPVTAAGTALATWWVIPGLDDAWLRAGYALAFGCIVSLSGLQILWGHYLRGLGQIRFASLLEGRSGGALVSLLQAAALFILWQFLPETGLLGAMGALVAGFLIPLALARRRVAQALGATTVVSTLRELTPDAVSRNWRFAVNQLAVYFATACELWLAGLLLPQADTSYFAAGQRVAMLLLIPLTAVQVVFAPVASRLVMRGDTQQLQDVLRTGASMATVCSAILWVPMLVVPELMLKVVFGPGFGPAATILLILTAGNLANVLSGLCGTALTMSQNEGLVAGIQIFYLMVRVAAAAVAASLFGVTGLAVSAAVVTVLTFATTWLAARTRLGIWTQPTLRPRLGLLRKNMG